MARSTILISINSGWNFVNFRAGLVRALVAAGYDVVAAAPDDAWRGRVEALGCRFAPLPIRSDSVSPAADLRLFAAYVRLFRRERPFAYLAYTAKPNIYGSLAAVSVGARVVNNISGLGTAFIRDNWLTAVVKRLYRAALKRSHTVFFQNSDDLAVFRTEKLVRPDQARLLAGSGIDLDRFQPSAMPQGEALRFLYVGRMLADKGVRDFAAAAARLRRELPAASFQLLGPVGVANRTAIPRDEIEGWVADGIVDYLGEADDVRPFVRDAHCVVLPSYREGLPRTLLEGAAMARPLVATDVPGCREIVREGINGFLCEPRDPASLAVAMARVAGLSGRDREALGCAGRRIVEREFSETAVIAAYLEALAG